VDTTPLGSVLGEVIVTEELEEWWDLPLPNAVTVANAISDGTPKTFLINFNISPSLKSSNGLPEVSGRQETQFC
jgi:hypothetical protein